MLYRDIVENKTFKDINWRFNIMKKHLILFLMSSIIISSAILPLQAQAKDLNFDNNSKITEICLEDQSTDCKEKMHVESRIPSYIISMFIKFVYTQGVHTAHTMLNWNKADSYGYNRYVNAVNQGRYCCYNMCPKHININPYNYGFKDSYRCHD